MNRKLHNSLLALSATGLMLVFGLMAASPKLPAGRDGDPSALQAPLAAIASQRHAETAALAQRADAVEARIEARAARLQAELDRSDSLGDTIASVTAFAAEVSTDAALGGVLRAADEAAESSDADNEQRRHARRVRGALAVPYFSFAQGLRPNSRS